MVSSSYRCRGEKTVHILGDYPIKLGQRRTSSIPVLRCWASNGYWAVKVHRSIPFDWHFHQPQHSWTFQPSINLFYCRLYSPQTSKANLLCWQLLFVNNPEVMLLQISIKVLRWFLTARLTSIDGFLDSSLGQKFLTPSGQTLQRPIHLISIPVRSEWLNHRGHRGHREREERDNNSDVNGFDIT